MRLVIGREGRLEWWAFFVHEDRTKHGVWSASRAYAGGPFRGQGWCRCRRVAAMVTKGGRGLLRMVVQLRIPFLYRRPVVVDVAADRTARRGVGWLFGRARSWSEGEHG